MKKTVRLWLVLLTMLPVSGLLAQVPNAAEDVLKQLQKVAVIEQKIMMPMRDGIRLATDIYRPRTDKPVPIIFSKTPYNFNSWGDGEQRAGTYQAALDAVKHGYAYVVQNERGKFFSEGDWEILAPRQLMAMMPLPGWRSSRGLMVKSVRLAVRLPPSGRWRWRPSDTRRMRRWSLRGLVPASGVSGRLWNRVTGIGAGAANAVYDLVIWYAD